MALPSIPLRRTVRSLAFRAVDDALRRDPSLRSVVKTWRSWRGDPDEGIDPELAPKPFVRLTPVSNPREAGFSHNAAGQRAESADFEVRVEIAVDGNNLDDVDRIWAGIQDALVPSDSESLMNTREGTLDENGISSIEFPRAPYSGPAAPSGYSRGWIAGEGAIRVVAFGLVGADVYP